MGLPIHLALVPYKVSVSAAEVTRVAAAISKQIERDFGPIWNIDATIDAFMDLKDIPTDYWPVTVVQKVQGAAGYHEDKNGQPFALVEFGQQWSITASHESLEMLADPFGRRLRAGQLLDQAVQLGMKPARVRYLVEVCDPSESGQFGYQSNGVLVSDFYTPHFFDPVKNPNVRYSFTAAIDSPRKVLQDGYISWEDPVSRQWFQLRMFPDNISNKVPHVVNLSQDTNFEKIRQERGGNLRSAVDAVTPHPPYVGGKRGQALQAAQVGSDTALTAQKARFASLAEDIDRIIAGASNATAPKSKGKRRR